MFSLRGFSQCACRCNLPAGAELAPRAGAGPSFLDEKKGSKDSPRGEFRFSPPWNPLRATKGSAFGNRERLPLWCLFTHRRSLRVKRVRKGSCVARKCKGDILQASESTLGKPQIDCIKQMRRSRTKKLRANESALKMPADRRDSKAYFPMKFGEWAFSLERLYISYRLHL